MAKVAKFYQDMTPNFECAAAIFKAIDPDMYKEYAACYKRTICSISGLKNVQNPYSVWCSMVIITNLNVDAHRDRTDRRDGWVLVQCFGDFRDGGHTVCPELGLKFNMRPGDIMLMRSAMLEHYVTSWKEGKRVSCVFWTHAGMFTWGLPKEGEKQEPASPDVTAPPDSRAARRRRAREAKAASDYNASQPQVHLPPCATHSAKHQSKTENMPEKERKWDWARWRKQQDAKEAEQAALLAHEVRTVLPQPLGPGLGEGVGYSERAGGVRAMDLSWKTEAEAKGQHQTGETIRTTIRANGKGMRRGNAEESRKVDSAAQTHAPAASKRMHQDSDGEDDEEPLYTMATVEDPYGLATDLVMVS